MSVGGISVGGMSVGGISVGGIGVRVLVGGGIGVLVSGGIGVMVGLGVLLGRVGRGVGELVGSVVGGTVGGTEVFVGCEVTVLGAIDVFVDCEGGSGVAVFGNRWQSGSALSIRRSLSSSNVLKQYSLPGFGF